MNTLFFSRYFYPHIGGVEKHVLEISNILKKTHEITIITELYDNKLQYQEIFHGIQIYRIPAGKDDFFKKFRIWKWLWDHKKLLRDADIIHAHDVYFWYFPFRFFYFTKPSYVTFHGYESYPIKKRAVIMRKISEVLAKGNICIGDFIKKWYGTKPSFVSYGGVDIKNSKLKTQNSKLKKNSALFYGRLDEQTGIKTYVDAVDLIKKKIPDFQLTVIGEGKFKTYVKKNKHVFGWKSNPEKYLLSHRFAFVSRYLSILEAMAAKKLVLAVQDNPVKKDYLTMTPFKNYIVIASSEVDLSNKVLYYLARPSKEKELVEKAYKWVQKQMWKKVASIYDSLWER